MIPSFRKRQEDGQMIVGPSTLNMLSRLPPRPPLITPSASPPPQPSSSNNDHPSPSKRKRTSSRSSSARRSVSIAEPMLDFSKERESSMARMLDTWSQLAERYSRRLDEDDIVDIRTGEIVKDNGFWKGRRRFNFGEAIQREDIQDSVDDDTEDDEGADELDAFEEERHYIEDGFAKDLQQKLLTHPDHGVATDLDEFLEAEQRRKEEYGSDVEEDELDPPLDHRQGERSPLSATSDSNGAGESSDTDDQDALSSRAPKSNWEEQESEDGYDDDDELDNWGPIEGSRIIPVRDWSSSPQAGASEADEKATKMPAVTSSKRRTPTLQIHTPPPSYSLADSSDSDSVVSPSPLSTNNTLGSSYFHETRSISPPSSPSKSRPRVQPMRPQASAPEIIEITDDESEPPSKPTKTASSPLSSSSRLPVSNTRRSVVPEVVITTLPPRPTTTKRSGATTALTTSNKSGTATPTKRAQKPTAPGTPTQPIQSAKSAKKTVVSEAPVKPSPARVSNKAVTSGTLSSSTTSAQHTKKVTSTIPTKPPSAHKLPQKSSKASVPAKTKVAVPMAVAPNACSDDNQGASEENFLHRETSPEAGGYPATPPSAACGSLELSASKSPPAKRKGRKRRRSSSVCEVIESTKVQTGLPLSSYKADPRGRARSRSAAPRRSSRRSLSQSKHLSDDIHPSSDEEMNYKHHPHFTSVATTQRMKSPYMPHTPTHHAGAYPPIVDARAQHIITQAMHQLATLFWTPTHSLPATPMYPYDSRHTYSSVGSPFMHSTPDHPHPYPFTFNPSLSAASLPPSSPEPPSSPIKPRERRKSLVPRSHSRGRKVSFRADEKGAESSEDEPSGSEQRNNSISTEGCSSPLRTKGKGKERTGIRHAISSGSEQEDGESHSERAAVKNTRTTPASVQKPGVGRSAKGRFITSGPSDLRSPKKPSQSRKSNGGSSGRL